MRSIQAQTLPAVHCTLQKWWRVSFPMHPEEQQGDKSSEAHRFRLAERLLDRNALSTAAHLHVLQRWKHSALLAFTFISVEAHNLDAAIFETGLLPP